MKSPEEVLIDVTRRLSNTWAATITGDSDGAWPHHFPLGRPAGHELTAAFAAVAAQAAAWRRWVAERDVSLRTRSRLVHGTLQQLPTHLVVPNIEVAAELAGEPWPQRISGARDRASVLSERYPHLADPARTLAIADRLSDVDFDLACRAADWFARNDAAGLTPRQVPVEGLHAKWLNTRQALVRELAGVTELGLAPPHPARLHFTYLDPTHRATGARWHDSATVGDAMSPAYLPQLVVISENKDTAIHFPPLPGAISVEGVGRGGTTAASFAWLVGAPLVAYWGDMDADGLEILDGYREAGVPAVSVLMTGAAYERFEIFGVNVDAHGVPLTAREPRQARHLTEDEGRLYTSLTNALWTRPRRIEQERIPLHAALAEVLRLADERDMDLVSR